MENRRASLNIRGRRTVRPVPSDVSAANDRKHPPSARERVASPPAQSGRSDNGSAGHKASSDGGDGMHVQPVRDILHATTVAVDGRGLLILGPSGSGKSGLALQLMALGAALVADDRTWVERRGDALWAGSPEAISGRIEARCLGILAAEPSPPVPVVAAVDLGRTETERLPPERTIVFQDCPLPLIFNVPGLSFAAALLQYLKGSRCA
jgi:HPr kinase/phosphorylase